MYKSIYNIKFDNYDPSDIEEVLDIAVKCRSKCSAVKDINIYVLNQNCIDDVLVGVTGLRHTKNSFDYNGIVGNIYTARTYKPCAVAGSEIVVAICVDDATLTKIEESKSIALMLVVPECSGTCYRWLSVHSAMNLQTKAEIPNTLSVKPLVNRCIGWLKDESIKLAPLFHLTMQDYIKQVTNLLLKNGITSVYDAILKQCLLRGLSHQDAYAVANIMKATAPYMLNTKPDYTKLKTLVDDVKWERN